MNLYDWYYKQVVSPGELSAAFEAADDSLRGMVTTLGIHGLAVGGDVVPTAPTPGLSAVVKGPVLAYDNQGSRIHLPDANLAVDLSQDENGAATAIFTPNQERYLGIFIKFVRVMEDARTDGDGNEVMFARLEAADVIVAAGAPAPVGAASRAAFREQHVLLADVRIITGQTQVTAAHILTDRTQYLFRATSGALDIWGRTFPEIVQKIVDRFAQFMAQMQQQFLTFSATSSEQFEEFKTTVNNTFNTFQQSVNAEVARLAGLIVNKAFQIEFAPASGIPSNNVQAAIEYVKNTIPGPTSTPNAAQVAFDTTWLPGGDNVQLAVEGVPAFMQGRSAQWSGTQTFNDVKISSGWVDNWLGVRNDIVYVDSANVQAPKIKCVAIPLNSFVPFYNDGEAYWERKADHWEVRILGQPTDYAGGAFSYAPPYNATVRQFYITYASPVNGSYYSYMQWIAGDYMYAYDHGGTDGHWPDPLWPWTYSYTQGARYVGALSNVVLPGQPQNACYEVTIGASGQFQLFGISAVLSIPGPI